jgi:hypothetical protein
MMQKGTLINALTAHRIGRVISLFLSKKSRMMPESELAIMPQPNVPNVIRVEYVEYCDWYTLKYFC